MQSSSGGISSVGRALAWHVIGHRFESDILHHHFAEHECPHFYFNEDENSSPYLYLFTFVCSIFLVMNKLEVWQRGPLNNIPALLQPIAHALMQAEEELEELLIDFPDKHLWDRPANLASPAFHLQHLSGVLDRVFTYARNEPLTAFQLKQLYDEDVAPQPNVTIQSLMLRFKRQVQTALLQLQNTNEDCLKEYRGVGRKQLPSTVIGLLVHAAEHTMRHVGQLSVTVKILKASNL